MKNIPIKKRKGLILIFIIILLPVSILLIRHRLAAYTTAYEGAKASFHGAYDLTNDLHYTSGIKQNASVSQFGGTMMILDSDHESLYKPNIVGEMTPVQIPLGDNNWIPPSTLAPTVNEPAGNLLPRGWWTDALYWSQPFRVFEWNITETDGSGTLFRMEEWKTKWFISFSAEWDSGPSPLNLNAEAHDNNYHNWEIWFEFDIQPIWYFEGQPQTYFSIAKVELSHEPITAGDPRFAPMSVGSILSVYDSPFGEDTVPNEQDFYSFEGKKLNPQFFRDKVYSKIILNEFGTQQSHIYTSATGDVLTMGFTVTQFVVGEWKVQDIGDIPFDYGRAAKVFIGSLESFGVWLSNPFNLLLLIGIVSVILIVILLIFAGPSLVSLYSLSKSKNVGGKRR